MMLNAEAGGIPRDRVYVFYAHEHGYNDFYLMRRGEVMGESCLRCHSTPEAAPAELVAYYGPDRSFGRKAGDVVSALSIRIPRRD